MSLFNKSTLKNNTRSIIMLSCYKLKFNENDFIKYNKQFDEIYKNKFKLNVFQNIFNHDIVNYEFENEKYINDILNQKDGNIKYNKIISDFIEQDLNCICDHFCTFPNKYVENNNNNKYKIYFQFNDLKLDELNKKHNYTFNITKENNNYILNLTENDKIENIIASFKNINNIIHLFYDLVNRKHIGAHQIHLQM